MFYFNWNNSIISKKIFKIIILSKVSLFSSGNNNQKTNQNNLKILLFIQGEKIKLQSRKIQPTKTIKLPPNNSEQEIFYIQKPPQSIENIKNPFLETENKINKYNYQIYLLLNKIYFKKEIITQQNITNFFQSLKFLHTLNSKKNIILNQKEEIEFF